MVRKRNKGVRGEIDPASTAEERVARISDPDRWKITGEVFDETHLPEELREGPGLERGKAINRQVIDDLRRRFGEDPDGPTDLGDDDFGPGNGGGGGWRPPPKRPAGPAGGEGQLPDILVDANQ